MIIRMFMLRNMLNKNNVQIAVMGANHARDIELFAKHLPLTVKYFYEPNKERYDVLSEEELSELAARFKTIKLIKQKKPLLKKPITSFILKERK